MPAILHPHPLLAEKVALLSRAGTYPEVDSAVARRETHMSWVFFVDGSVYKLKKPVRLPYLDFSTLARREAACRSEFRLNQRLAPGIYRGVVPLTQDAQGLRLGGRGRVVDWLVHMRRLDEARTLEAQILARDVTPRELSALADYLARFYRQARRVHISPAAAHIRWRAALGEHARVLLDPQLGPPGGLARYLIALERRFLQQRCGQLAARAEMIVNAHGDLRPEHIWLDTPPVIIDRLEFSAALRAVDPADELAFLDLECERLGERALGARLRRAVLARLHGAPSLDLYLFYRIQRALLRARLSLAHLAEPHPRTPEKWPAQAQAYLAIAARDARSLERCLRTPADPSGPRPSAAAE